jgi:predicted RNA polymerase sigma factor
VILLEYSGADCPFAASPFDVMMDDEIPDDRLKLIFTCCHPTLALEAQVALTLHTLGGLSTQEVARAFLVPEPTMAKRLVRAQDSQRRHPLSRAARRTAARTIGCAAGGDLPDLQRGLRRHQR